MFRLNYVPGAEWIGTVHVDLRRDNGLFPADLRAAFASGMRRVSFGLETGSQALLDAMEKGSSVEANSAFIRHAFEAGLSIRTTMFRGFPGETAEDMAATADFLEVHERWLDRVSFNEFVLLHDTPIYHATARSPSSDALRADPRNAISRFRSPVGRDRHYRRELRRALSSVYRINRKALRSDARQFDGLM